MDTTQLKRIADALEEVLRLVKEDQERSKKYMEEKKMSRRQGSESIKALVNHWRWLVDQGPSYKLQASSDKLRHFDAGQFACLQKFGLQSVKRQATSVVTGGTGGLSQASGYKIPDSFALIKFWKHARGIQNHDKCILRMLHMEGYLVWRKFNFICFSIL